MEYHWTIEAYAKVAFHACKYLTHPLTGLLLGYVSDKSVQIVDAIPLFHSAIVSPTMELALLQVDDYASKRELKLIGVYTATSFTVKASTEPSVNVAVSKVATKLKQFFNDAFVFVVRAPISMFHTSLSSFSPLPPS